MRSQILSPSSSLDPLSIILIIFTFAREREKLAILTYGKPGIVSSIELGVSELINHSWTDFYTFRNFYELCRKKQIFSNGNFNSGWTCASYQYHYTSRVSANNKLRTRM